MCKLSVHDSMIFVSFCLKALVYELGFQLIFILSWGGGGCLQKVWLKTILFLFSPPPPAFYQWRDAEVFTCGYSAVNSVVLYCMCLCAHVSNG